MGIVKRDYILDKIIDQLNITFKDVLRDEINVTFEEFSKSDDFKEIVKNVVNKKSVVYSQVNKNADIDISTFNGYMMLDVLTSMGNTYNDFNAHLEINTNKDRLITNEHLTLNKAEFKPSDKIIIEVQEIDSKLDFNNSNVKMYLFTIVNNDNICGCDVIVMNTEEAIKSIKVVAPEDTTLTIHTYM